MLNIGGKSLKSRLFLGTGRYPSPKSLQDCIKESEAEVVTVSLRREAATIEKGTRFWDYVKDSGAHILPNTAGCYNVKDAVTTAHMARELFNTDWIKLEVIGNDQNLQPDPFGTVEAAKILIEDGFQVFPYTTDDLVVAEKLVQAGCKILMPWGSPIGTGRGLTNPMALKAIRKRFPDLALVVDAGIGKPSHATMAMELGYDAVLVNTAVSKARNPVIMANAFKNAVISGRQGYEAGMMKERDGAVPSSPSLGIPFLDSFE